MEECHAVLYLFFVFKDAKFKFGLYVILLGWYIPVSMFLYCLVYFKQQQQQKLPQKLVMMHEILN